MGGCTQGPSKRWKLGRTGKAKYETEEDCLAVWAEMNPGGKTALNNRKRNRKNMAPATRRSTVPNRGKTDRVRPIE